MTFTEPTDEQYRNAGRAILAYLGSDRRWDLPNIDSAMNLAERIADIANHHIPEPRIDKDSGEVEFWRTVADALDIKYPQDPQE